MQIAINIVLVILGLAAVVFAFNSDRFRFNILNHMPGPLKERKVMFVIGLAIILGGFVASYWIGPFHGFIGVFGGWLMLLGSAEWFNLRVVRKLFAPVEHKVIRITLYTGLFIAILSTGLLSFPPMFSPGVFLLGLSLMIMGGRLWWNEDIGYEHHTMKHSKRDYS